MSKECPSCHADCSNVYQCDECGHMFCNWCGRPAFFSGGPIAMSGCPICEPRVWGPFHTKVSVDDDSEDSVDNEAPAGEESSSSDQEATSDESSYSSSDDSDPSSSSGSESWGEGIVVLVVIVILVLVASSKGGYQGGVSTNQANQPNQPPPVSCTGISADGTRCYNEKYGWISRNSQGQIVSVPAPPDTQPRTDTYFFQNTVPGTYNMVPKESQKQSNAQNPNCDAAGKIAWYFVEFCRNPELAALSNRVGQLDTILFMADSREFGSLEPVHWQLKVDETCKRAQSPPDCLHSELEARSQFLQARITEALASNSPGLFKKEAQKLWAQHNW